MQLGQIIPDEGIVNTVLLYLVFPSKCATFFLTLNLDFKNRRFN